MPFIARFNKNWVPPFYGGPGPVTSIAPIDKETPSPPYDYIFIIIVYLPSCIDFFNSNVSIIHIVYIDNFR